jgi:hypothetical protein
MTSANPRQQHTTKQHQVSERALSAQDAGGAPLGGDPAIPSSSESVAAVVAPDVSPTATTECGERGCRHCGRPLPAPAAHGGRRRRYCNHACREAARLRRAQGLPEAAPRVRPGGRRRLCDRLAPDQEDR